MTVLPVESVTTTSNKVEVASDNRVGIRMDMVLDFENSVPPFSGGVRLEIGGVNVQGGITHSGEPDTEDITSMNVFGSNRVEFVDKCLFGNDPHTTLVGGVVRPQRNIAPS